MRKGQPFASHISEGAGWHTSTNTSGRAGVGVVGGCRGEGIPQPTHMGGTYSAFTILIHAKPMRSKLHVCVYSY